MGQQRFEQSYRVYPVSFIDKVSATRWLLKEGVQLRGVAAALTSPIFLFVARLLITLIDPDYWHIGCWLAEGLQVTRRPLEHNL